MNIFISWSGDRSLAVAIALQSWLQDLLQNVKPWVSDRNIDAGTRWSKEVAEKLSSTQFGIICLTKENLSAGWILFEAGAIAKSIENTYVVPYLIDLGFSDIPSGPLTQFQGKKADKQGTLDLLQTINRVAGDLGIDEGRLERNFERYWSDLEKVLTTLPKSKKHEPPKKTTDDKVGEILEEVRKSNRMLNEIIWSNKTIEGIGGEVYSIPTAIQKASRKPRTFNHNKENQISYQEYLEDGFVEDYSLLGRIKAELQNRRKMMLMSFLNQCSHFIVKGNKLVIVYAGDNRRNISLVTSTANYTALSEIASDIMEGYAEIDVIAEE